jgi:hypothetical protein
MKYFCEGRCPIIGKHKKIGNSYDVYIDTTVIGGKKDPYRAVQLVGLDTGIWLMKAEESKARFKAKKPPNWRLACLSMSTS